MLGRVLLLLCTPGNRTLNREKVSLRKEHKTVENPFIFYTSPTGLKVKDLIFTIHWLDTNEIHTQKPQKLRKMKFTSQQSWPRKDMLEVIFIAAG